jgi:Trypsin-like peptidase domain
MEAARIAEIFQGRRSRGSGYLISPRLVLTARHVTLPARVGTKCQVQLLTPPDSAPGTEVGQRRPPRLHAKVAWVSQRDDLAVVALTDGPIPHIEPRLLPLGRIPPDLIPRDFRASGFPEASGGDQRTVEGRITWVLNSSPYRFAVDVTSRAPTKLKEWAGFSGTALFVDDLLVAIVETVDSGYVGGLLGATPVEYLLRDPCFHEFIEELNLSLAFAIDVGSAGLAAKPKASAKFEVSPLTLIDFRPTKKTNPHSFVVVTLAIKIINPEPETVEGWLKQTIVELKSSNRTYQFLWHYFVTLLPGHAPDATWISARPVVNATASKIKSEFSQEIMHFPTESLTWLDFMAEYNATKTEIEVNVFLKLDTEIKQLKYSFDPREYEPYDPEWPFICAVLVGAKHA